MDKKYFLIRILVYLGVLTAGVTLAAQATDQFAQLVTWKFLGDLLIIASSIILINLVDYVLAAQARVNIFVTLLLLIAFSTTLLANVQAFFISTVLFATSFLYHCKPLQLKRFAFTPNIIYALNSSAIFMLGWFLLYRSLGFFPQLLLPLCYFLAVFVSGAYQLIFIPAKASKLFLLLKTLLALLLFLGLLITYTLICYHANIITYQTSNGAAAI